MCVFVCVHAHIYRCIYLYILCLYICACWCIYTHVFLYIFFQGKHHMITPSSQNIWIEVAQPLVTIAACNLVHSIGFEPVTYGLLVDNLPWVDGTID